MGSMDLTTLPSTTKAPYPQVNIRKYSPKNRPTTTRKPRTKPSRKSIDVNKPQGDQPRTDLTSFLPHGYKLNASDDRSSRILEELLNRVKPKNTNNSKEKSKNEKKVVEEKPLEDNASGKATTAF